MAEVQWIKVNTDIFDNEKIKKLLRNRDGDSYLRVWIQLLTLAAKCNANGAVLIGENIPMTLDDLAKAMHKTLPKLTQMVQALFELDMILVEDGTIYIKNWNRYQNADELEKIREQTRKRVQNYREKRKAGNVTETLRNTKEKNREEQDNKRIEERTQTENESGFKD